MARRPGVGGHRALLCRPGLRQQLSDQPPSSLVLLTASGALGERLHYGTQRCRRYAEPLRRERTGALRALPRSEPSWQPQWYGIGDQPDRPARGPAETVEQSHRPERDGPLWVRIPVEYI